MQSRKEKKRLKALQRDISDLDAQMRKETAPIRDPNERQAIETGYIHEIFMYLDETAKIKTDALVRAARDLPVAVPDRHNEKYWEQSTTLGHYQLTDDGLEKLDTAIHEAKMRRVQRFQAWFTPTIAILALFVSIASILIQEF